MKRQVPIVLHSLGCFAILAFLTVTTSAKLPPQSPQKSIQLASAESVAASVASAARQFGLQQHMEVQLSTGHTGQAISQLLAGQIDLAIITRPLTHLESKRAYELGKWMHFLTIGFDGVVVVVHPTVGRDLKEIGLDELRKVFVTGEYQDWSQLTPGKHQGTIRPLVPQLESGTTTTFLRGLATDKQLASHVEILLHLEDVVSQVASDPRSIGITASGAGKNGLATLPIRDDHGKVHRCQEFSLRQGHYPFVLPVFAVMVDRQQAHPDARTKFYRYLGSVQGQEVLYNAGLVTTMQVTPPTAANATLDETVSKESHGKHH